MKSQQAYDKVTCKVSTKYGVPSGRHDVGDKPEGRIYNRRVPLDSGGYDKGGVYWGVGSELRVKYNGTLTYVRFYREE